MNPIFIDLETRSACDLKEEGSYKYAKHPTTRLLTVAWRDGEQDHVWLPGLRDQPPASYTAIHLPGVRVHVGDRVPNELARAARRGWVGHNCWTFDRLVWDECTEQQWPVTWHDTYPLALACGMPGGLDAIGKLLWGDGKYTSGKDALKKASRATGPDDCEPENVPVGQLMLVAKYNVQDVRLTAALWERVQREAKLPPHEHRVKAAHDTINTRGIRIDLGLTRALVTLADESKAKAIDQIAVLTDGKLNGQADVQSAARVKAWLAESGVRLKNAKNGKDSLAKNVVSRYIDAHRATEDEPDTGESDGAGDEDETNGVDLSRIVKVLELRMSALRITGGKLDAALHAMDDDRRIRFWSAYWAAHTGRWAGRRIQPHNLPRPKEGVDTWALIALYEREGALPYDQVRALLPVDARGVDGKLLYPYLSVDDAASALLRGIFLPDEGDTLAAADLANIEARVLAWCADEKWLMEAFWDGADPYLAMAEKIVGPRDRWPSYPDPVTGKPLPVKKHPYRQILGKIPYLAAGYQGGANAIALYAAGMGYNLADYGTSGQIMMKAYRCLHSKIAGEYVGDHDDGRPRFRGGLWADVNAAAIMCVQDCVETYAGRCRFSMAAGNLICTLPSGRRLVYRSAELRDVKDTVPWDSEGRPVWALTYWSPRFGRKYTYGGSLVENIVQAISRDVLAHGMVMLEDAGMPVVLHVHDELVSTTKPDRLPDFMRCVTTCPPWLTDFPLAAEGSCMPRYSKSPKPPEKDVTWRNGTCM